MVSQSVNSVAGSVRALTPSETFLLLSHMRRNKVQGQLIQVLRSCFRKKVQQQERQMPGGEVYRSKFYSIYRVGSQHHMISRYTGRTGSNTHLYEEKLTDLFSSTAYIQEAMHALGYSIHDIQAIVEEYDREMFGIEEDYLEESKLTEEDILAEALIGVTFLSHAHDKAKSLELCKNDLDSRRLSPTGISFERYIDELLDACESNGLNEFGYARDDTESIRTLKSAVQHFIQLYRSSHEYLRTKREARLVYEDKKRELREGFFRKYGLWIDDECMSSYHEIIFSKGEMGDEYSSDSGGDCDDDDIPF